MRILWEGNRGWTIIAVSKINGRLLRTVGYGSLESVPQSGIGDRRIVVANPCAGTAAVLQSAGAVGPTDRLNGKWKRDGRRRTAATSDLSLMANGRHGTVPQTCAP